MFSGWPSTPGVPATELLQAGLAGLAGHSGPDIWQILEASTLRKFRRIQRAPDPTPDFQVEAEEDIKSETSGTLQNLFLALAKVRRTDLQKKGVTPSGRVWGRVGSIVLMQWTGGLCGGTRLICWPGDKTCPSKSSPERVSPPREAVRATLKSLTIT